MNRIEKLLTEKKDRILSVYFTAGFPENDSTADIITHLQDAGADMIEIGMPFSDPLADGPVIQMSNTVSLRKGMNLRLLFSQIRSIKGKVRVPLILMGYINPVLRFGVVDFCRECEASGIDGVILPDLPPEVFSDEYAEIFEKHNLMNIFLVSPLTGDERIRYIDTVSRGFIYVVSSSSTTGRKKAFSEQQMSYFRKLREMQLTSPLITGFGISDADTYNDATRYTRGAIIGSAFIDRLAREGVTGENIASFIAGFR